jgi:hypothetical protein
MRAMGVAPHQMSLVFDGVARAHSEGVDNSWFSAVPNTHIVKGLSVENLCERHATQHVILNCLYCCLPGAYRFKQYPRREDSDNMLNGYVESAPPADFTGEALC